VLLNKEADRTLFVRHALKFYCRNRNRNCLYIQQRYGEIHPILRWITENLCFYRDKSYPCPKLLDSQHVNCKYQLHIELWDGLYNKSYDRKWCGQIFTAPSARYFAWQSAFLHIPLLGTPYRGAQQSNYATNQ